MVNIRNAVTRFGVRRGDLSRIATLFTTVSSSWSGLRLIKFFYLSWRAPPAFFFDIAASYPSISLGAVANQLTFLLSEITLTLRKFVYLT